MSNKKKYMLDTSVIIDNPASNLFNLYQNGANDIYICDTVLKELDKHKTSPRDDISFSARTFFRSIDNKSFKKKKKLSLGKDTVFQMKLSFEEYPDVVIKLHTIHSDSFLEESNTNDLKILEVASIYKMKMITNDLAFEISARSIGVDAESIKADSISDPDKIDFAATFYIEDLDNKEDLKEVGKQIFQSKNKFNQITLKERKTKDQETPYETGRVKYYIVNGAGLIEMDTGKDAFKDLIVKPLNLEQKFYTNLLRSPFNILAVTGSTGSGKTLLALQEGLRRVKDKNSPITGVIYMRYTVNTTDKFAELGFRKGDEDQKLGYYSYPLYSAINFIIDQKYPTVEGDEGTNKSSKKNELTEKFIEDHNVEVYDIAHARGVTFTNKFIIFDEVQNAPNQILKLIGTRCGEHTPIVLMGDYKQVDHPFLTKNRNSLISMLRISDQGDPMIAAIKLTTTVRSDIAEWFDLNLR